MATVISGNKIKLDNGQIVTASENGWFDGQNFSNGVLGARGVKISPGVGQGQAVSDEVNLQSDKAQGLAPGTIKTYIANAPAPTMTSKGQVQNYTNSVQNGAMGTYVDPTAPKVQTLGDITSELKNLLPVEAPTAPNMMDTYNKLTEDGTVTALEKSIIDLKAQKADALAQLDVNRTAERSKPVAENVVQGRISEQTRMAQEKVDFIDRQITTAADELTMRYKSIETIMKYTQLDFENAKSTYDTKFTQAMTLMTQARGIQQDQLTEQQRAKDNARANLQIFANAITSGNMNLSNLSPDMAASLNGMELSAGLPMGFIQSLKMSPKDQIAHINDRTGEVFGFDGNGGLKIIGNVGASTAGAGGYTATQYEAKVSSAMQIIDKVDKSYQTINGKLRSVEKTDAQGYTITAEGDQRLSAAEINEAYRLIKIEVGGDEAKAEEIWKKAWSSGGYVKWGN